MKFFKMTFKLTLLMPFCSNYTLVAFVWTQANFGLAQFKNAESQECTIFKTLSQFFKSS